MNRRDLIASLGTAVSLTGCLGDGGDTASRSTSGGGTPTEPIPSMSTATSTSTETPTPPQAPSRPGQLNGLQGSTDPDPDIGGIYEREFTQTAHGQRTTWKTGIPKNLYEYAKARLRTNDYGAYVADRYDDPYIERIAEVIKEYGNENNLSDRVIADHAVAIVQGMEYTRDKPGTGYNEYPKYPAETLVDRGGDCEDTSILMVSLLRKLGYDARLLLLPSDNHMAVAVRGAPSIEGTYYEQNGSRYYYLETTGSGWTVGELPPGVSGSPAQLVHPYSYPVLVFSWVLNVARSGGINATVRTKNMGTAVARTAQAQVVIEDGNGAAVAQNRVSYPPIAPDQAVEKTMHLSPPDDRPLRVSVGALLDGKAHDFDRSELIEPE